LILRILRSPIDFLRRAGAWRAGGTAWTISFLFLRSRVGFRFE
jgi:hypothetical protein